MSIRNGNPPAGRGRWARAATAWLARGAVLLGVTTPPGIAAQESARAGVHYHVFAAHASPQPLPANKRVPFGWPAFSVGTTPVTLSVPAGFAINGDGPVFLRLTTAIDDRQP